MRGSRKTTAAAALPRRRRRETRLHPAADVRDAERTPASGVIAALSSRPSRRARARRRRTQARRRRQRRTTASADHLVAAARQRDPSDRGGAARGGEREDGRAARHLRKRCCQPHAFAAYAASMIDRREPDEPEVRVLQRPPGAREMARDERRDCKSREDEDRVEKPLQGEASTRSSAGKHSVESGFSPA